MLFFHFKKGFDGFFRFIGQDPNFTWDTLQIDPILVAQMVKNLPAMLETQVQSMGQEDPLEKGMATQSSILVSKIPWTEEPGRLQSIGSQSRTRLSK